MSTVTPLSPGDRLEIVELYARYTHAYDEGNAAELCDLFTSDGQFIRAGADPVTGHAALAAMVRASAARGAGIRHLVSAVVVETVPDGGRSSRTFGRAYVQVVGAADPARPVAFGRYDDEFVLDSGRWRIRSRVFSPFSMPVGS